MSELMNGCHSLVCYRLTLFTEEIIENIYFCLKISDKFVIS